MAMKFFKITMIVIIVATLIQAVRISEKFPILQSLPLLGGSRPIKYEIAGIALLCITALLCLIFRRKKSKYKRSRQIYNPNQGHRHVNRYHQNYRH